MNDLKQVIESIPRCNKCATDAPVGRTIGLHDESKVWAVGINPKLRDISTAESFRDIKKIVDNGKVLYYLNIKTGTVINIDSAFFDRINFISNNLFKLKSAIKNEFFLTEDYYSKHNDEINRLFSEAVPAANLTVGQGIGLTDVVKCFTFDSSKLRESDVKNTFTKQVYRNCLPFFIKEFLFKRPQVIFFTYTAAYDHFVEMADKLQVGDIKSCQTIGETVMSQIICRGFSCYLIRGTFTHQRNLKNKRWEQMKEQVQIAVGKSFGVTC